MKNNSVCKENRSNVFRKEREQYHEIQDLKAQMHDKNIAISELKKLIEKCKGKSVETQFDKPSVVRQPNAQRILKPSVLGKPTPFLNSPEMRSTLFNGQKQQRIDLNADALYNEKQENLKVWLLKMLISQKLVPEWPRSSTTKAFKQSSSSLGLHYTMTSVHISSGLVLHQITSDHNHSELRIHDHSNEPSSLKLVPKVIHLAIKTATSRQELELLFHHHIAMLRTTGSQSCLSRVLRNIIVIFARTFRVILFSIHNANGNPSVSSSNSTAIVAERLNQRISEELTDEEKAKLLSTNGEKKKSICALKSIKKKVKGREKTTKGSRKKMLGRKRAGKEQQQESSKKQKVEKEKESDKVDEVDEAELKKLLVIKKDEDIAIDAIPVATKLPVIIDYKLH
ncbi:hypothetical protein Tco_0319116 [Tanacetum coccineum]